MKRTYPFLVDRQGKKEQTSQRKDRPVHGRGDDQRPDRTIGRIVRVREDTTRIVLDGPRPGHNGLRDVRHPFHDSLLPPLRLLMQPVAIFEFYKFYLNNVHKT